VLGEALYVGTNAGTMYALDPATGAIQWSTGLGERAVGFVDSGDRAV
jgi:outer membrane protein assembly factor BamB